MRSRRDNLEGLLKSASAMIENGKHGVELEIRTTVPTLERFSELYKSFIAENTVITSKIEQSVVAMRGKKGSRDRYELYFIAGKRGDEKNLQKNRHGLYRHRNDLYRASFATEEPIPGFELNAADNVRVRLRSSLVVKDIPHWRFDFTIVIQLQKSQLNQLKTIKEQMFPAGKKYDPLKFIDELPAVKGAAFEIEIEYIGGVKNTKSITADIITAALSKIGIKEVSAENGMGEYHVEMFKIAKEFIEDKRILSLYKYKYGLKQFANNPKTLGITDFYSKLLPNIDNYYVSDKADGERALMVLSPDVSFILVDKCIGPISKNIDAIYDVEVIAPGTDKCIVYIFDVLKIDGKHVSHLTFDKREQYLSPPKQPPGFTGKIHKKILVKLTKTGYGKQIQKVLDRKDRDYPIDGLIFTEATHNYFDMSVWKWKDPKELSVDFLLLKAPDKIMGIEPYIAVKGKTLYILCVGISHRDSELLNITPNRAVIDAVPNVQGNYFPIQFETGYRPKGYIYYDVNPDLHMHIAEFVVDADANFKLNKMRPDKDVLVKQGTAFGNNFRLAEEMMLSFANPLTLEILIGAEEGKVSYFQERKRTEYTALTKYNSFVKAQVLKLVSKKAWIVDLAAGKGQDLFTYNSYEVKNGLFVDIDAAAIQELNRRKYSFGSSNSYVFAPPPKENMRVYSMIADLSDAKTPTAISGMLDTATQHHQVDAVVINFAIHYIIDSMPTLDDFSKLVDNILKPGGVFIFTAFNGRRVFDVLEKFKIKYSEHYDFDAKATVDPIKYSIKRLYKDSKYKPFGNRISAIHPFSKGEYYEENLIDIDTIAEHFVALGYTIQYNGSFIDWYSDFATFNPSMTKQMDSQDKLYTALYQYVSLIKNVK